MYQLVNTSWRTEDNHTFVLICESATELVAICSYACAAGLESPASGLYPRRVGRNASTLNLLLFVVMVYSSLPAGIVGLVYSLFRHILRQ